MKRLKDIFESDDRFVFIQRPGVEEANLPDVLERWTLRYVELAFLRAARGSSRRCNLRTVLLWMDGQESTEGQESTKAFGFAFGPLNEYLDVLRTLTLKGKAFLVFGFEKWSNQLQLIKDCYSGQENVVSEFLKVGAPAETSPLFTFMRSAFLIARRCLPGLCALYWRLVL